jgi:hypothetical protein
METIETKPNNDAELSDFILVTEHKCDCTIELISFALLLIGALISYKYALAVRASLSIILAIKHEPT